MRRRERTWYGAIVFGAAIVALAAACDGEGTTTTTTSATGSSGFGAGGSSSSGLTSVGAGPSDCPECIEEGTGVGTDNPFDVDGNPSDGVGVDDDGALVLDIGNSDIPGIIWIANTSLNTVSKVDTTTYDVLGRYTIGTNDPSRTSVNSLGDVFVGNRSGNSLTKISAAGQDCPDTNGDGMVTTSTGFGDVYMFTQDDCMLWDVTVPNNPTVRGVAAQDVTVPDPLPDWPDHTKQEHFVWVGGTSHPTIYKYDGETGQLLIQTESPNTVYGLALDGSGNLWSSGYFDAQTIGRTDTNLCADQASCDAAPVCVNDCRTGACVCDPGCGVPCDQAVKERILLPSAGYGITVDFKQRVWTGGSPIQRYDPSEPPATRYASVPGQPFIHGIAADGEGFIWGAAYTDPGIIRVDGDTLATEPISGVPSKGIAVDKDGKIWGVQYGADAHVVVPGPTQTLPDYTTQPSVVTGLGQCYTYSDMTGLQLALANQEPGYYKQLFEGCDGGETTWYDIAWEGDTPPGTGLRISMKSANDPADIDAAQEVLIAKVPSDMSPQSVSAAYASAGVAMGKYAQVIITLIPAVVPGELPISPRLLWFNVRHTGCLDVPA